MDKRVIRFDGWVVDFESGEISKDGDHQPPAGSAPAGARRADAAARRSRHARAAHRPPLADRRGRIRHRPQHRDAQAAHRPRRRRRHARATSRRCRARDIASSRPSSPNAPAPAAVPACRTCRTCPPHTETGRDIGRRASDRRAPLQRLALGFGSIAGRGGAGVDRLAHARQVFETARDRTTLCRRSWSCRWST